MLGCRLSEEDNMAASVNHFEMRRLEALSNTIFGVAMTLLAYNLPKGQILNGPPVWSTIWAAYQSQIAALLISFVDKSVRLRRGLGAVPGLQSNGRRSGLA
jgi:hypothetical protein